MVMYSHARCSSELFMRDHSFERDVTVQRVLLVIRVDTWRMDGVSVEEGVSMCGGLFNVRRSLLLPLLGDISSGDRAAGFLSDLAGEQSAEAS